MINKQIEANALSDFKARTVYINGGTSHYWDNNISQNSNNWSISGPIGLSAFARSRLNCNLTIVPEANDYYIDPFAQAFGSTTSLVDVQSGYIPGYDLEFSNGSEVAFPLSAKYYDFVANPGAGMEAVFISKTSTNGPLPNTLLVQTRYNIDNTATAGLSSIIRVDTWVGMDASFNANPTKIYCRVAVERLRGNLRSLSKTCISAMLGIGRFDAETC